ncbi:hypothetical protein V5O48_014463 [Marasmius crinis-equi]|uniref:Uncharacterized protein n=1 Tax=Marasmius crinis-equi TaxID=585013 RepID=A0ABR3EXJ1_9AGAR
MTIIATGRLRTSVYPPNKSMSQRRLQVMRLLSSRIASCKKLSLGRLEGNVAEFVKSLCDRHPDITFPDLRALSLTGWSGSDSREAVGGLWKALQRAPLLRQLTIMTTSHSLLPPDAVSRHLTTLTLHIHLYDTTNQSYIDLLLSCEHLSTLQMSCSTSLRLVPSHVKVHTLPSLKSLAFEPECLPDDMVALFGSFYLPNLITLDIILDPRMGGGPEWSEYSLQVFRQCAWSVSSFSIWMRGYDLEESLGWVLPLLEHTPNLVGLTIFIERDSPVYICHPNPALHLIAGLGLPSESTDVETFLLPRLECLRIYDGGLVRISPELAQALIQMVESRIPRTPLRSIAFLYCLPEVEGVHFNRDREHYPDYDGCIIGRELEPSVIHMLERLEDYTKARRATCRIEHASRDNLFSPTRLDEGW